MQPKDICLADKQSTTAFDREGSLRLDTPSFDGRLKEADRLQDCLGILPDITKLDPSMYVSDTRALEQI